MSTVGHVRRVENHAVVQQRAAAFIDVLHLCDHLCEKLCVPRMNLAAAFAGHRIGRLVFWSIAVVFERVSLMLGAPGNNPWKDRIILPECRGHNASRICLQCQNQQI